MGKLTELQQWEEDIYQIETSDPVLGGPDGITNKPAKQLSNRTQWLKARLEAAQNALAEHERSRNHPDASLTAKGFTQLYSGVISLDETMAATPKAVKIAMDNANARLAKDRNGADIPNVALFRQNIELGNSATLNVGTTINTVAAGDDPRFTNSVQKANNLSDLTNPAAAVEYLGLTEWINKVNDTQIGRPNQSLIEINTPDDLSNLPAGARRFAQNASGVSVLPTNAYFYLEVITKRDTENGTAIWAADATNPGNVWLGVRYNASTDLNFTWSKQYSTQNKPTAADVGAVPATRTINGKPLTTNISLNYDDVRAVSYMCKVNGKYLDGNPVLTAADVGAVPTTRTVNGKALSTDIRLTAADIGVVIPSIPFIPKNTALTLVNGWWKCGDTGLIIQWGIVPANGTNTQNYPLPMTFPNRGLWALGQSYWAMPYGEDNASGSATLFDNATIRVTLDNGVPTAWIAIGY